MAEPSPANGAGAPVAERKRIPMSLPRAKLAVPEIPGFHLHWMADRPGRVSQALQGGYEFVEPKEIAVASFGLANDVSLDGNTDMGTRVSVVGGAGADGKTERLYLMKIRQEWWLEDQALLAEKNQQIADTINRRGLSQQGESATDAAQRYVKSSSLKSSSRRP